MLQKENILPAMVIPNAVAASLFLRPVPRDAPPEVEESLGFATYHEALHARSYRLLVLNQSARAPKCRAEGRGAHITRRPWRCGRCPGRSPATTPAKIRTLKTAGCGTFAGALTWPARRDRPAQAGHSRRRSRTATRCRHRRRSSRCSRWSSLDQRGARFDAPRNGERARRSSPFTSSMQRARVAASSMAVAPPWAM